jgi:hypothetical protein
MLEWCITGGQKLKVREDLLQEKSLMPNVCQEVRIAKARLILLVLTWSEKKAIYRTRIRTTVNSAFVWHSNNQVDNDRNIVRNEDDPNVYFRKSQGSKSRRNDRVRNVVEVELGLTASVASAKEDEYNSQEHGPKTLPVHGSVVYITCGTGRAACPRLEVFEPHRPIARARTPTAPARLATTAAVGTGAPPVEDAVDEPPVTAASAAELLVELVEEESAELLVELVEEESAPPLPEVIAASSALVAELKAALAELSKEEAAAPADNDAVASAGVSPLLEMKAWMSGGRALYHDGGLPAATWLAIISPYSGTV